MPAMLLAQPYYHHCYYDSASMLARYAPHLKIGRGSKVLHQIRCNPALMAICFVVEVKHVRLWIQLRSISAIILDCIDVGECFHPKLAVEPSAKGVEDLILFLRAMPHYNGNESHSQEIVK